MIVVRERNTPKGRLVSLCDRDCIGECYREGELRLDVTEEFYGGPEATEMSASAAMSAIRAADVVNIVGEESVNAAITAGLVDEARVLRVAGQPHAQLLWL
jgi:hypothetical protein